MGIGRGISVSARKKSLAFAGEKVYNKTIGDDSRRKHMTEEQAGVFLVKWFGNEKMAERFAYWLTNRGYRIESFLTGEDYEKQQARDFPVSGHLPGDTKENSGGN
jgi:hypothetical protein